MTDALKLVNEFYAVTFKTKRVEEIAKLVADDFKFEGPLQQSNDAAGYIEINRDLLPAHVATRMLHQFLDGLDICSIYEIDLRTPRGDILTAKMADWISVRDGKLASQSIYYDTRDFVEAFGIT